jgi:hypothetical protein
MISPYGVGSSGAQMEKPQLAAKKHRRQNGSPSLVHRSSSTPEKQIEKDGLPPAGDIARNSPNRLLSA